ncbi:predicted protein [Aspergillus terreus NIH2624]|uniref:Uncharacterized protein n=1 Tax=Aspergillus terreus (strain NIH 2624 / FGSC A1156) TaxID=341663 RepID=Q0C8R6_ASPTN|nr:uncharacterized protein ATEG_09918 [Aspergillus terreus NIH2624]EAU30109.1 predicted protein [Aspergillus terreus NIH2624]
MTGALSVNAALRLDLHPVRIGLLVMGRPMTLPDLWRRLWPQWKERLSKPHHTAKLNPAVQSQYIDTLLEMEQTPLAYNLAASICTWLVLAGFLVFPGTFTTLRESSLLQNAAGGVVYRAVQHIPLLSVAIIFCALGTAGCGALWWGRRANYIWPTEKIFLPVLIHSVTGLLNTILNVYTARGGTWSVIAIVTVSVSGAYATVAALLFAMYHFLLLQVKADHRSMEDHAKQAMCMHPTIGGSILCGTAHDSGICEACQRSPNITVTRLEHRTP